MDYPTMIQNTGTGLAPASRLFRNWFVKYNPLYFVSALCFVFGAFIVSREMNQIEWVDGQIILTAVIELYQVLLLAGSFILYRLAAQSRPAVMLVMLNIIFLFDCTYQTEQLSSIQEIGGLATAFWVLLFALKLWAVTRIFRLKVPGLALALPVLAAIGIAYTPYLLADSSPAVQAQVIFAMITYVTILASVVLLLQPRVTCVDPLSRSAKAVLGRVSIAAWLIWAGMFMFHLISWIYMLDIPVSPATFAPLLLILAFLAPMEELAWAGSFLAPTLSLFQPELFGLVALMSAAGLGLRGYQMRQPRLLTGAILALYLALRAWGWETGPLPDSELWLTVPAAMGFIGISLYYRSIFAALVTCTWLLAHWRWEGPQGAIQWGAMLIVTAFVTLVLGIATNWIFRVTTENNGLNRQNTDQVPQLNRP